MSSARPSYYPDFRTRRRAKVLFICYYEPNGVSTVPENVAFLQRHSRFSVHVINMYDWRVGSGFLSLPPEVDLSKFSAVIVHNTISYNPGNLRCLDKRLGTRFADYRGIKILFKQDENYRFQEVAKVIGEANYDVLFTCLPPEAQQRIYPEAVAGRLHFERMLTGYVTPTHRELRKQWGTRPLDIAYRGSIQPLDFGRLAYEKAKIGDDIRARLAGRGLVLDISSRWEDRIGGSDWFEFLLSSKTTLGAESGASIFDLDGSLMPRITAAEQRHRHLLPDRAAFAEAVLTDVADLEGNIHYNQVSPRHFEAAATGTVQAMYPGTYSGIFVAGRHFFELQRDYSNIDDLISLIGDDKRRQEIAEAAHNEIVSNRDYWIETFVERVDAQIENRLPHGTLVRPERSPLVRASQPAKNVLLLAAHEPVLDPRLNWTSDHAPSDINIVQIGLTTRDTAVGISQSPAGKTIIVDKRDAYSNDDFRNIAQFGAGSDTTMAALGELSYLAMASELRDPVAFAAAFGAKPGTQRADDFRWYCRFFVETTASLLNVVFRTNNINAIIAADLETLLPGVLASGILGVPLFYDAHEYWPESDPDSQEFERLHWRRLERRLVKFAQYRHTVSDGIAKLLSEEYGVPFEVLPNAEPRDAGIGASEASLADGSECRFLFQGNFAPYRGIDLLISAWSKTHPRAKLLLRGPDSPYKKRMEALASETGLLGDRIRFLDPVPPDGLMAGCRDGHVGLIPYTAAGPGYAHCCPNKLSQYMAASLPVFANKTTFVTKIVLNAENGAIANFSDPDDIAAAVLKFITDPSEYRRMAENSRRYFLEKFHWEKLATDYYSALSRAVRDAKPSHFELYPKTAKLAEEKRLVSNLQWHAPPLKKEKHAVLRALWHLIPKSVRYPLARTLRRYIDSIP